MQPVWSPDSRRVAFSGDGGLHYTEVGSGKVVPVPGSEGYRMLEQWTADGKFLVARKTTAGRGGVGLLPAPQAAVTVAESALASKPIFDNSKFAVDHFQVSSNGKWVAYTSEETGRPEVMVAPFPALVPRRQVSVGGGEQPRWRADGRELFFISAGKDYLEIFMAALVDN